MKFNEAQLSAIHHLSGPGLCLAGPGSGKTAVITNRVLYLTGEKGILPGSILVITFTKAAALEMKARYEKLLYDSGGSEPYGQVNFGTFHAFFFKILKQVYHLDASSIIRENEAYKIISDLLDDLAIDTMDRADLVSDVKNEISRCKTGKTDIMEYSAFSLDADSFRAVFKGYGDALKRRRLIDFDDMMAETEKLFTEHPEVLQAVREKYRYVMVDEFQDVNRQQYEMVKMLVSPHNNLFIVGDDDQSIYGFRGSEPGIMLGFKKDFPEAREYFLNVNYRSKSNIVEAAGRLIRCNKDRFEKKILAAREAGEEVAVKAFATREEELVNVASMIMEEYRRGRLFSQMAILTRTNAQAGMLPGILQDAGVRFRMRDGDRDMYSHWAISDVLTYIRMAHGEMMRDTVLKVINRPVRYLSRNMFDPGTVDWEKVKQRYRGKQWAVTSIEQLEFDLNMIRRASPVAAVKYVRKAVRYDAFIMEYCEKMHRRPEEAMEVLEMLEAEARRFSTVEEWFSHMERVRQELMRQRLLDGESREDAVTVLTMHGAKGLEYESVYITGAVEGGCPYIKATTEAEIEEERRMFYVAMTRAKSRLTITYFKERDGFKVQKSRFLKEMG